MEALKPGRRLSYAEWRASHPRIAGGAPLDDLKVRNEEIRHRLKEIDADAQARTLTEDEKVEWNNISAELERNEEAIIEGERRRDWLNNVDDTLGAREEGVAFGVRRARSQAGREDLFDLTTIRTNFANPDEQVQEAHDRARRAIEGFTFQHEDIQRGIVGDDKVRSHMEYLLQSTSEAQPGMLAFYMLRHGSPLYKRAFGKKMMGAGMTVDEERALSVGTGSAGGYAVPITLDPTMIPVSNGVVNPLRAIARKETIAGLEYRGLTAGAVVASYAAEATEASDNSPTMAQPDLFAERAQAFIPYSIEVGMDWNGLLTSMAKLISDAKDKLEGLKFTLGAGHGSNEPKGLLVGATSTVSTGSSAAFGVADLYALEESLPPRFRPLAQFFGSRHAYNLIRQFGASANQNLWLTIAAQNGGPLAQGLDNSRVGNMGQLLLGYGANEVSDMVTTLTTGSKILALGDPNYYLIIDRIGMTIEQIPQLFGTVNNFPTGQRGIFAYWRNTGGVVDPAAFRVLTTS